MKSIQSLRATAHTTTPPTLFSVIAKLNKSDSKAPTTILDTHELRFVRTKLGRLTVESFETSRSLASFLRQKSPTDDLKQTTTKPPERRGHWGARKRDHLWHPHAGPTTAFMRP